MGSQAWPIFHIHPFLISLPPRFAITDSIIQDTKTSQHVRTSFKMETPNSSRNGQLESPLRLLHHARRRRPRHPPLSRFRVHLHLPLPPFYLPLSSLPLPTHIHLHQPVQACPSKTPPSSARSCLVILPALSPPNKISHSNSTH